MGTRAHHPLTPWAEDGWVGDQGGNREWEESTPGQEAVIWGQEGAGFSTATGGSPWDGSGLLGDILVDPVQVAGDTGVDAGPVGLGTAVAPADHTRLQPGAVDLADQGPS